MMNLTKYLCIYLVFCFVWIQVVNAQKKYSFKQISYEQGLPSGNIRDQFEDSRGIMWFAIDGMGLCRYDGFKFKLFTTITSNANSISCNLVNKINEDTLGYLWIATDEGLNRYDYRTGKFLQFFYDLNDTNSIPDNVIYTVDRDNNGNVWIGTENGFALIDPVKLKFKRFLYVESPEKDQKLHTVYKVYQGKNGILWIGSSLGLIEYNHIKKNEYHLKEKHIIKDSHAQVMIYDLEEDNFGNLWIASASSLNKLNLMSGQFDEWIMSDKNRNNVILTGMNSLLLDKDYLWAGTSSKGLIIINTKDESYKWITKNSNNKNSIQSNHIRSLFKDKNGTIWIGTKFGGLFKYFDKNMAFNKWPDKYQFLKPISDKYILSFFEDSNNIFWIGTKYSGVYKVSTSTNSIINITCNPDNPKTLTSERVQCILRDSNNKLWIGTDKGLNLLNETDYSSDKLTDKNIHCIIEDRLGTLWVGTSNGLFVIDKKKKKIKSYGPLKNMDLFYNEDYEILNMFLDSKGYIWYSTQHDGVFVYHPETNKYNFFSKKKVPECNINANMIRPVYEDSKNNIWIGTKEIGIVKFNRSENKFISFDINHGLPSNMILCIEEDFFGNLWLGTNNGISKFELKNQTFANFNQDYGIKSNVCELGASHRFKDGALLFGGSNGFNIFYPGEIVKTEKVSPLIISSIKIFETECYRDITNPVSLKLNHKENNISFEFNITNYNQPSRHQFKCFMEGIDDNWKNLGNRNYTTYTNINPGKYKFYVNGADEMGTWSKEITVEIQIMKPWWQTWIFRILIVVFMVSSIFAFYYVRLNQIEKQKRELEKQVVKRTKELHETNTLLEERQQQIEEQAAELNLKAEELTITNKNLKASNASKNKLFSIIAHDLKNPFSTLLGFNKLILEKYDDLEKEKMKDMIAKMLYSAQNIYTLLENLLHWSRTQSQNIKFNPEKINLFTLCKENTDLLKNLATQKDIKIRVNVPEYLNIKADKLMAETIIRNILTNAIKFTDNGTVSISSEVENKFVKIKITDTGTGIPKDKLTTLFEMEKSKPTKGTQGEVGTGLGLIICKEFAEINGGTINVYSKEGEGSTFIFTLPLI